MIKTPQNQQRLTNVAIVKLKKSGKRFEVTLSTSSNQLVDHCQLSPDRHVSEQGHGLEERHVSTAQFLVRLTRHCSQ